MINCNAFFQCVYVKWNKWRDQKLKQKLKTRWLDWLVWIYPCTRINSLQIRALYTILQLIDRRVAIKKNDHFTNRSITNSDKNGLFEHRAWFHWFHLRYTNATRLLTIVVGETTTKHFESNVYTNYIVVVVVVIRYYLFARLFCSFLSFHFVLLSFSFDFVQTSNKIF